MRERAYPDTHEDDLVQTDRAVLVGVDRGRTDWPIDESLAELSRLADTAGIVVVASVTQRMERPHPKTFIGKGKVEEVNDLVKSLDATTVIFDDDLTPSQQSNLTDLLAPSTVLDRTALILEIFGLHATTREGKLQVELARLEYMLPRLKGMWGHLEKERLGGGRGTRFGAGESQLESDRRMSRRRISELKRELGRVSTERSLQRSQRGSTGVFRIVLVGYTNAGKSTLLNALTDAGVLAEDMLFATLDSTTRRLELPEGPPVTVTDTVGFINKLPHSLVEAFRSTLDEVVEADLLLIVADAGAPQRDAQLSAVREVLQEIGAHSRPSITVYNKMDALSDDDGALLRRRHPAALFVSALTGTGVPELRRRIGEESARGARTMTVLLPFTKGELVGVAHERCQVVSEHHEAGGTVLVLKIPAALASVFEPYAVSEDA